MPVRAPRIAHCQVGGWADRDWVVPCRSGSATEKPPGGGLVLCLRLPGAECRHRNPIPYSAGHEPIGVKGRGELSRPSRKGWGSIVPSSDPPWPATDPYGFTP